MATSVDELRKECSLATYFGARRPMPFCRNCGADVAGAKFCGNCGSPTGERSSSASGGSTPSSPQGTGPRGEGPIGDLGLTENAAAAVSYLLLPAAIFLVIEPYRDSRFIRFHCFQAIFCAAAILIALAIMTTIVSAIIRFQCCPGKVVPSDGKSRPLNVLWPVLPGNDLKSRGRKWSPERSIRTRHNEG